MADLVYLHLAAYTKIRLCSTIVSLFSINEIYNTLGVVYSHIYIHNIVLYPQLPYKIHTNRMKYI